MSDNKITDWFNEAPSAPNPWQEAKPKLTKSEIEKAAAIYISFVDPYGQSVLYHIIRNKCHRETFNKWWPLVCGHNRNPVDNPYSVDQYIKDKNIAAIPNDCPNAPCHCGACDCES